MGLDQYFYVQKKGTAKKLLENGQEIGYFRKAWSLHRLIEETVGQIENGEPVRLMESDLDAIWAGVPSMVENDYYNESDDEWFLFEIRGLGETLVKAKVLASKGWQVWYYADW